MDVTKPSILDSLTAEQHKKLLSRACQVAQGIDPHDLLQDVFVKILENQHRFEGRSSIFTYAHGFIGNLSMNHNTVMYGRGARTGRRALLNEFKRETTRLQSFHGKRTGVKKSHYV